LASIIGVLPRKRNAAVGLPDRSVGAAIGAATDYSNVAVGMV